MNLNERMLAYESSNQKLLNYLPVIILANGRNFKRLCRNLKKPLCEDFAHLMVMSMFYAIKEMPGAVFGYQYADKIIFVLKNGKEQSPWLNNIAEEISSTTSSLLTKAFDKFVDYEKTDLIGDSIFSAKTFNLPKLSETVNYLIWKQNAAKRFTIDKYSKHFLIEKLGKLSAVDLLEKKSTLEKADLLKKHCNIAQNSIPFLFEKGCGLYKVPLILPSPEGSMQKNKWHLDKNLPNFMEDKFFIGNILKNGHDIFREMNM